MGRFRLPVEEFTTPNPVTAKENATIDELQALMKAHGIRHVPIVNGGVVIGIVSDRDVKVVQGLDFSEKNIVRAGDIMVPDPITVGAGAPLDEVAFEMSKKKIGSVIVNDESDQFLGIFTVTDALNALIEIVRGGSSEESQ